MVQSWTYCLKGGGCYGSVITHVHAIGVSSQCRLEEEVFFLTILFRAGKLTALRAVLVHLTLVDTIPGRRNGFVPE